MTIFTLSFAALESLASLKNATPLAKTERALTPILTAIRLTVDAERWTASATDRYTAAEVSAPNTGSHNLDDGESLTVLLDSDALAPIVSAAKPRIPRARVNDDVIAFEHNDEQNFLEVRVYGSPVGFVDLVAGNHPPVERLYPNGLAERESIAFDPEKLARLGKVLAPSHAAEPPSARKGRPLKLSFTDGPLTPILVTRYDGALSEGETFRALLMPNKEIAAR